jgi:hypothetical protein
MGQMRTWIRKERLVPGIMLEHIVEMPLEETTHVRLPMGVWERLMDEAGYREQVPVAP